jgi:hypothetical protein
MSLNGESLSVEQANGALAPPSFADEGCAFSGF